MIRIKITFGLFLLSIFLYSCWTSPDSMGEITVENSRYISMVDIYNVLKNNFSDYIIELKEIPEDSSFMIFPYWGKRVVKTHYHINMDSEKYSIIIQNGHNVYGELTDIYIDFYLKGQNAHERLNELNEPMEKMKFCLNKNFTDIIKKENISQKFKPEPYR